MNSTMILTRSKLLFLSFLLFIFSCSPDNSSVKTIEPLVDEVKVEVPEFNADSAYRFVQEQVNFGPRVPNSKSHKNCAAWLQKKLTTYNWTVTTQEGIQVAYDNEKLNFTNIIASFQPEKKERILLTAHWDTRPWGDNDADSKHHKTPIDGANDGGSGVGVLLEIARILQQKQPKVGVDIILFDIEDYGNGNIDNSFCYGSQYWSKNITYKGNLPQYAINLDMVGDMDAVFSYEGYSNQYARPVLDKVWTAAHELGYQKHFLREASYPVIDDHLYVNQAGIPCIDIIHRNPSTGKFPDSWHTHDDKIEKINVPTLKAVGQTLLKVIYSEGL